MAFEKRWDEKNIATMKQMWDRGKPIAKIAELYSIKESTVIRYAKKFGFIFPQPKPKTERETRLSIRQTKIAKPMHSISINPGQRKKMKDITEVPEELLIKWSIRLFALMNLAWDYVDTILDLCIQQRISETKPLCRTIRELKRDYDKFRSRSMTEDKEREEEETAMIFEEMFDKHFKILAINLDTEVRKYDLNEDHTMLVIATQQAMTLIDAVKIYAKRCDKSLSDLGVWTCDYVLVQTEFLKMASLIPQFAGNCYKADLPIRKQTAMIFANSLERLPIPEQYLLKA